MRSTPDKRSSEARALFDSAEGTVIAGHYQVESILGGGAMSIVYKCKDIVVGRTVVLKIMQPQFLCDQRWHARFLQEARTVGRLDHRGIVKLHEFKFMADVPCIVMDYIEGNPLAHLIAQCGAIEMNRAVGIAVQITDALVYAHQQGVVHRDLKPSNIMVRKDDSIVIVDFGIAKVDATDMQVAATQTGEVFGSPAYMSPEQISGKAVDARADQYALACMLFECLTGAPPFVGESAVEIMFEHLNSQPATLQEASLGKDFPPGLELIVKRMLEKEPEKRFSDMNAVKQSLSQALDPTVGLGNGSGKSTGDKAPSTAAPAGKNKLLLIISASIIIATLGTLIVLSLKRDAEPKLGLPAASSAQAPQESRSNKASNLDYSTTVPVQKKQESGSSRSENDKLNVNLWLAPMEVPDANQLSGTFSISGPDAQSVKNALEDKDLLGIPRQRHVEKLDFSSCPHLNGTGVSQLGGANIKSLDLDNCGITDDGLRSLSKFPELQNLYLDATKITDKGLESLTFVPNLAVLTISSDSQLTGSCLQAIAKLNNLTQLEARSTNVAAGLKYLKTMSLKNVQLGGSNVSDEGLKMLAEIKTLKVIGLNACDISDRGLESLTTLRLTRLDLTHCPRLTKAGIKSFAAKEQHCRITR